MAFDPPQNGVEPTRRGDIQKIKETLRQIEAMATVKTALPLLKPFMRLLGIDSTGIEASLQDVEKLRTDIKALSTIPDDFNDLLSDRGWIIYTAAPATVREETRKPPTWVEVRPCLLKASR